MSVELNIKADSVQSSTPHELFALPRLPAVDPNYSVTADGKRFLVRVPVRLATQPLSVIVNWPAFLN